MAHIAANNCSSAMLKLDGRTKEARHLRDLRAQLTDHVGGQPSVPQRLLIEQAQRIYLRILTAGAATDDPGSRLDAVLALERSFRETLAQIGVAPAWPALAAGPDQQPAA